MLNGEKIHRIGIRGKVALQVKVGGCGCCASRLARPNRKVSSKTLNLVGAERLILGTREVARNVTEKLCGVAERQEPLEAKLKEVFAEQQHYFCASKYAQFARESESVGIRTKQLVAPRMKGLDRRRGVTVGHQPIDTPLHLLGRALRKGQRQDLFRLGALLGDKPGDPTGDDLRLTGSRTGNHQKRPISVCNGGVLFVVEIIDQMGDGGR